MNSLMHVTVSTYLYNITLVTKTNCFIWLIIVCIVWIQMKYGLKTVSNKLILWLICVRLFCFVVFFELTVNGNDSAVLSHVSYPGMNQYWAKNEIDFLKVSASDLMGLELTSERQFIVHTTLATHSYWHMLLFHRQV